MTWHSPKQSPGANTDFSTHPTGNDVGAVLRRLRKAAGLSGERLAVRCAMSQSKISRIERGKLLASVADVERILVALEVPRETAEKIIALARRANVEHVSIRALAEKGLWRAQFELKALTEASAAVRSFLLSMPNGLIQIPDYVRAVVTPALPSEPARDVEKMVDARLERQRVLDDPNRHFTFILTEQAVRWRCAERSVMARQCAHMAELSERPNIEIAVVPLSSYVPDAPLNNFLVLDERMVIIELFSGRMVMRDYKDIKYHIELFELYYQYALTGDRARAFLLSTRDEFM
ncbi:helix-turn-helix transcriptional regulator [Amycolatopsis sp. NPDC051128]|uniref:helix-turn-helix domain-containing protein n=1 Tax=Amycolatopsis sp. NPDC051128 TaxID=3155412 RepID=UPI00341F5F12